jgi:hypothetical protein
MKYTLRVGVLDRSEKSYLKMKYNSEVYLEVPISMSHLDICHCDSRVTREIWISTVGLWRSEQKEPALGSYLGV